MTIDGAIVTGIFILHAMLFVSMKLYYIHLHYIEYGEWLSNSLNEELGHLTSVHPAVMAAQYLISGLFLYLVWLYC